MCGIAGMLYLDGRSSPDRPTLERMQETLLHRGPDGDGTLLEPPVGLAIRRLSIIDLEGGDQPIGNEDGTVQIVFNGEIYNYPELRRRLEDLGHRFRTKSDTETVVHSYEQWGEDCLRHLNGMFAFALWDAARAKLILARDRTGIKPLYYANTGRSLVFGSEVKALLANPAVKRELDLESLGQYLALEYVPSPRSIFRGVQKVRPGHYLRASAGSVEEVKYWDFDLSQAERGGAVADESYVEQFLEALRKAVAGEMLSDVPVGVLLSGGLDSSSIAALMVEQAGEPVQSFSITFDDPSFDEGVYSRRVAEWLGTVHRQLTLTPRMLLDLVPQLTEKLDEPFADPSVIPTHLVARFAREHVKVVLGGDGGDEMLAGYSTLQAHRLAPVYKAVPRAIRTGLLDPLIARLPVSHSDLSFDFKLKRFTLGMEETQALQHQMWLGSFYGRDRAEIFADGVAEEVDESRFHRFVNDTAEASGARQSLNRALYQDMKLYLEGDILTKLDRASMAVSLEARVPFLNNEVLTVMARTPLSMKLRGLTRKYILRKAMEGRLPPEIIGRKKKGFSVPVARWLASDLKGLALEYLNEGRVRREGLFSPECVNRLLREHFEQRRNNHKMLWTLLMFQMWRERWLDSA